MSKYLYDDLIYFGNLSSNVAVTTLWSKKEDIVKHLDMNHIAIAGQLYSKNQGINALIRNCLRNKKIRYLFITGDDINGSGQALINLFNHGISENKKIVGENNAFVDKEIPKEAIQRLRKNVTVFDRRTIKDHSELNKEIQSLQELPAYGEAEFYPEHKPEPPAILPSENAGFKVYDTCIGDAWLKILNIIMNFGGLKKSQFHDDQKEVLNLITIIDEEDPNQPDWKEFYEFTYQELENYFPQVLSSQPVDGVEYTYGQRLRNHKGIDQIQQMINQLIKCKYSRRAIAFTWDVETDHKSSESPCLDLIQAVIQDNKLHLTAYLRSNDMYGAWPLNAYALRKLQKFITEQVGVSMGSLITISCSAHIYESNWTKCREILHEHYGLNKPTDPRGNFLIKIKDNKILATHIDLRGQKVGEISANNAKEIMEKIQKDMRISDLYHSMYLGKELQKAEIALKEGRKYIQDESI